MPGQGKTEQRPHKVSFTLAVKGQQAAEVISALDGDLKAAGLSAKIIYSGGEDLDILPQQASKGKGLEFLLEQVASHPRCSWGSGCGNREDEGMKSCGFAACADIVCLQGLLCGMEGL